jgi:hypothetical protein
MIIAIIAMLIITNSGYAQMHGAYTSMQYNELCQLSQTIVSVNKGSVNICDKIVKLKDDESQVIRFTLSKNSKYVIANKTKQCSVSIVGKDYDLTSNGKITINTNNEEAVISIKVVNLSKKKDYAIFTLVFLGKSK